MGKFSGGLSQQCYDTLVREARGARRVLEFGPGHSTQAFIDAGVPEIVSLEHDPKWLQKSIDRYAKYHNVHIFRYTNSPVIEMPHPDPRSFDLAFVDSPVGHDRGRVEHPGQEGCARLNTLTFALQHSRVVLLHDAGRKGEQRSLERIGRPFEMITPRIAKICA